MSYKRISPAAVAELMAGPVGIQLVDIRDEQSYALGHIEGALHLHNGNLATFLQQADWDRPLVVYCYHGNSSQPAAQYLQEQGFEEVYSMDGGFEQWRLTQRVSQ